MKVSEQAMYLAELKGLEPKEAKRKLEYWFEKFEITSWWDKKLEELSKGMAQKIQFITTILHEPKLLIFDEPFSGFDPVNAELLKQEILSLRNNGATIIFRPTIWLRLKRYAIELSLSTRQRTFWRAGLNKSNRASAKTSSRLSLQKPKCSI